MTSDGQLKVLWIVVCAAVPARTVQELVVLAQEVGWDVHLIVTPNAQKFANSPLLAQVSGHPVLIDLEEQQPLLEQITAVVVVPATFNTLSKWAEKRPDTFALAFLLRAVEAGLPILVVPRASSELAQEPSFLPSLVLLQAQGVHVLYDLEAFPPNNAVPWHVILEQLQFIAQSKYYLHNSE
ncbi:flavoprotein [Tengunoibacter tsumagoiensis]|uniref:Flavoprotein domain-containing protein n=1 Tax=Tengunoibacter tsumagoiensis TaxID=2014871 RepID=A0A402A4N0_9CHLR|nr:flavoprotein [Tengunoibacter tsumagoiensis]GCE14060.1 hypothetical protein KTT_39190 [Tengunoibacter tsumagoiensis]